MRRWAGADADAAGYAKRRIDLRLSWERQLVRARHQPDRLIGTVLGAAGAAVAMVEVDRGTSEAAKQRMLNQAEREAALKEMADKETKINSDVFEIR